VDERKLGARDIRWPVSPTRRMEIEIRRGGGAESADVHADAMAMQGQQRAGPTAGRDGWESIQSVTADLDSDLNLKRRQRLQQEAAVDGDDYYHHPLALAEERTWNARGVAAERLGGELCFFFWLSLLGVKRFGCWIGYITKLCLCVFPGVSLSLWPAN
jgi:hypothetical protein